jgi:hypothetical protein
MVYVFINAGMPDSLASDQFRTGMDKMVMSETVQYQNKRTRAGTGMNWYSTILKYRMIPECRCPAMVVPFSMFNVTPHFDIGRNSF